MKINKYSKWYFNIIDNARSLNRQRGDAYFEGHHVYPKSIYGDGETVLLTAREHFICHWLLTKMFDGKDKSRMVWALHRMAFGDPHGKRRNQSRHYEVARKIFQKNISEMNKRPKTESEKKAMRGPRPHVNQTGSNNNNFQGYYITPWGTFTSAPLAASSATKPITQTMVSQACKNSHRVVKCKSKYDWFVKGKTLIDCGFYFVRKAA